MAGRGQIAALGRLDGVREATLCATDGTVIESSSSRPELDAAAASLFAAMQTLQESLQSAGTPVTLTVDVEQGTLQWVQGSGGILMVSAGTEANLGAVRLEMREAMRAFEE